MAETLVGERPVEIEETWHQAKIELLHGALQRVYAAGKGAAAESVRAWVFSVDARIDNERWANVTLHVKLSHPELDKVLDMFRGAPGQTLVTIEAEESEG